MKKTVILFVALVIIVAAFAACGPANALNGLWYEKTGYAGTMEFKSGGVVTMKAMGVSIDGTYTFDAAKNEGTITISAAGQEGTTDFTLSNGEINIESAVYTRDKVEQKDIEDMLKGLGDALGN